MTLSVRTAAVPLAVVLLGSLAAWHAPAAHAQLTLNIFQSDANVDMQATGKLNLTGLTTGTLHGEPDLVYGSQAAAIVGDPTANPNFDEYVGVTGPLSFGRRTQFDTTSGSGDRVGIAGGLHAVFVPTGYVSGTAINGSAEFANQTLSSLGLTTGTYIYTLSNNIANNTITVNIGPTAPLPELSTLLGFGSFLAIGGLAAFRQRRRAHHAA